MMDLVSRPNSIYQKRDIEMGLAVMCSSTHRVFIFTHAHISFADTTCAFSIREQVCCFICWAESKATLTVQHNSADPSVGKAIRRSFNQYKCRRRAGKCKLPGRPRTSKNDNKRIRLSCQRSLKISLARQKL